MKRKQLSGAENRKLKAEKQLKENAAIAKTPKIDQLFRVVPSTSTSSATESVEKNVVDETHAQSDCEIDSPATHERDETEKCDLEGEGANECISDSMEFPTDAGSWDIPSNITSLQNYWIGKGE